VRTSRVLRRLAVAALLMAGPAVTAHAQLGAFERLVNPGPVSNAHAEFEKDCKSCHAKFERDSQQQLCLDCHKEIGANIASGTGFHGRSREVKAAKGGSACASCHTEHRGRDADIVGLDRARFDHGLTDFPLHASHATVACDACHAAGQGFHEAETECFSCHAEDDKHHGNLGRSCSDCHAETMWTEARFDHEAKTGYALTGAHARVDCAGCHAGEHYAATSGNCVACHKADDKHKGTNGTECASCHVASDWARIRFDHFAVAMFALTGGHAGLECTDCHAGNKFEHDAPSECNGCHRKDDVHKGVNGPKCESCHRATKWLDVSFDHERDGHFALRGAHARLECNDCHVQPVAAARLGTECSDCHGKEDPHSGKLGAACSSCHNETSFVRDVRFDHDLTAFPLLGRHAAVACDGCHESKEFVGAPERCESCHAKQDAHAGRLGSDCGLCHNANGWKLWVFDHGKTGFALEGAHANADCLACHRRPLDASASLPKDCGGCHRADDVHRGEFGQNCERCHTTESFAAPRRLR
jgi:hypothetical protein